MAPRPELEVAGERLRRRRWFDEEKLVYEAIYDALLLAPTCPFWWPVNRLVMTDLPLLPDAADNLGAGI